jgi:hypothetical protein
MHEEATTTKSRTSPLTKRLAELLAELKRGSLRCERCGRPASGIRMIAAKRVGYCNGGDCREAADLDHRVAMLQAARKQARRR